MSDDVRIVIDEGGLAELQRDPAMAGLLLDALQQVVSEARRTAPRRTGAGARSIRAEAVLGTTGWEGRVSWDTDHAYMRYQRSHAIQDALAAHFENE